MSDVNKEIGLYPMSGDVVRFVSTAKLPIGGVETELHPIQDLHGYEYPWPAGGGSNIWDEEWEQGTFNSNNGEKQSSTAKMRSKNYIPVVPDTTYRYICDSDSGIAFYYGSEKNYLGSYNITTTRLFTTPSDCYFLMFTPITAYGNTYKNDISIALQSSGATTYRPYSNICPITGKDSVTIYVSPTPEITDETVVHEIDFGETVYEGTLTINEDGSGKLVATRYKAIFTGEETYNNNYFPTVVATKIFPQGVDNGNSFINSFAPSQNSYCNYVNVSKNTIQFGRCDTFWNVSNATELKAKFAEMYANGTPVEVCYELAEPIEYNLTVDQIKTLIGYNYVWNNVGTTNIIFQYYTGGGMMIPTFLDCWTYPKAKLDEMFKAVTDRLDALEEAADDSDAKTTLLETKEKATEDVAEEEGDE